jgi:uncharacterized Zn-binding protein involved in type VI secretion
MAATIGGNYGTLHRAIVRSITATGVTVEIPLLAPNASWGPIPTAVPNLAVGEAVICAQISTSRDTLVVLGRVPGRASTVGEIPTLSATIAALQATDAAAATSAAALTARVTTAEGNITAHGTRLTTDEANITTNTTAIAAHGTRLTTDEANITTNTTGLATANTAITANGTAITAHGVRLTALEDLTAVGKSRTVYQKNDHGGTTYTNSTDLVLPVVASGVYLMESQLIYDTTTVPQIKIKFLLPTGSPTLRISPWFSGDPAGNAAIWHDVFDGVEFFPGAKSSSGGYMSCRPGVMFTVGTTAGNLNIQFAQNTADVAFAVLKVASWMRLTRML